MELLKLTTIWQWLSTEVLDRAITIPTLRDWALRQGERQLYTDFVIRNEDHRPGKVQEMRYLALRNLLHSVDRALAEGRISTNVRRSLIQIFIGQVIIGESERMKPFHKIHGYHPPSFLTISPTKKCNLRCIGCYAASSARNDETLEYEIFHRVLREKTETWGSHLTVISGGEPLMYRSRGRDLFDLLEENQDNYFMMYTNATLIDQTVARKMADVGNITPAISVEGWREETDARRGKGVFKKIQRAMENLREAGVPFGISVTATRDNAEIVLSDEFMDYYFNQQGAIYGWIFQYMPIGRGFTVDKMVTPEQRLWMLEQEMTMLYEKKLFLVDFWNGGPMSVGCIAAGRPGGYFYIDWNGNIAPCVFFPYYIDNLYEIYRNHRSLTSVLESGYFRSIRKWQNAYAYRREREETRNLFIPCAIRDHYKFAARVIKHFGAKAMDENAEMAGNDPEYARKMLEYDQKLSDLFDPVWVKKVIAREKFSGQAA